MRGYMHRLHAIVFAAALLPARMLAQGAPTLEQSLALWERGEALAARCEEWLLGAKRRLDAARAGAEGTTS